MRVVVLSVYWSNYQPLADLVLPNISSYCNRHGYELVTICKGGQFQSNSGFEKIKVIRELFEEGNIDLIWCPDLDIIVTNPEIKLESFLEERKDFYICEDINGLNSGSTIWRNTQWSKDFLDYILSEQNKYPNEQEIIQTQFYFIKYQAKILGHPSINSIAYDYYLPTYGSIKGTQKEIPTERQGNWNKNHLCLHLPGFPLTRRVEIFKKILNEING